MYETLRIPFLAIPTQSLQRITPEGREVSLLISNVCFSTSLKRPETRLEETRAVRTPMRALIRLANNTSMDAPLNDATVNPQRRKASGTTTAGTMIETMTETMGMTRHLDRAKKETLTVDHHRFKDEMTDIETNLRIESRKIISITPV